MERSEMKKHLKKQLSKERYEHTLGVMYTAASLAMAHGYPIKEAMTAGLLHDCAKHISNEEKIKICEKKHIWISEVEYEKPCLLHAKVGAYLAETEYKVKNPEILHAIQVHTTGKPDMNLLDKIIFVADYIEPLRDKAPNLERIRMLAFSDLNCCIAEILHDTLSYLLKSGGVIDPTTQRTYDFYKQYMKQ